jgi:site-specific DNA-cytosine methylase
LKLVEQFRPKISIIENVPGMKNMKILTKKNIAPVSKKLYIDFEESIEQLCEEIDDVIVKHKNNRGQIIAVNKKIGTEGEGNNSELTEKKNKLEEEKTELEEKRKELEESLLPLAQKLDSRLTSLSIIIDSISNPKPEEIDIDKLKVSLTKQGRGREYFENKKNLVLAFLKQIVIENQSGDNLKKSLDFLKSYINRLEQT